MPPRPERRHAPVRRTTDEAGHDGGGAGGDQRTHELSREPRRRGKVRGGAAVMAIGNDNVDRVDVLRPPADAAECRGENLRRHALAARDEQVARSRRQVTEHADGDAQFPVLARGRVDGCQQLSPRWPRRHQAARHVTVAAEKDGGAPGRVGCSVLTSRLRLPRAADP